eukprot:scaffold13513_cov130-Isochrysis_galbana.AAC.2
MDDGRVGVWEWKGHTHLGSRGEISIVKDDERTAVEVGYVVVDPLTAAEAIGHHGSHAATIATHKGCAQCESRGIAEGSPIALHVGVSYRPILSRT